MGIDYSLIIVKKENNRYIGIPDDYPGVFGYRRYTLDDLFHPDSYQHVADLMDHELNFDFFTKAVYSEENVYETSEVYDPQKVLFTINTILQTLRNHADKLRTYYELIPSWWSKYKNRQFGTDSVHMFIDGEECYLSINKDTGRVFIRKYDTNESYELDIENKEATVIRGHNIDYDSADRRGEEISVRIREETMYEHYQWFLNLMIETCKYAIDKGFQVLGVLG